MNPSILQPGDVCLYKGTGLYGWVIRLKTWHDVGHVEVYAGNGSSVASRNGVGVQVYPLRTADLLYVLRPTVPFDAAKARAWFTQQIGTPYGWFDLLQFIGLNVNPKGVICSAFATQYLRAGGVPIFGAEQAEKIAPFEFLLSDLLTPVWPAASGTTTVAA